MPRWDIPSWDALIDENEIEIVVERHPARATSDAGRIVSKPHLEEMSFGRSLQEKVRQRVRGIRLTQLRKQLKGGLSVQLAKRYTMKAEEPERQASGCSVQPPSSEASVEFVGTQERGASAWRPMLSLHMPQQSLLECSTLDSSDFAARFCILLHGDSPRMSPILRPMHVPMLHLWLTRNPSCPGRCSFYS